jgi:hypothetical protein
LYRPLICENLSICLLTPGLQVASAGEDEAQIRSTVWINADAWASGPAQRAAAVIDPIDKDEGLVMIPWFQDDQF